MVPLCRLRRLLRTLPHRWKLLSLVLRVFFVVAVVVIVIVVPRRFLHCEEVFGGERWAAGLWSRRHSRCCGFCCNFRRYWSFLRRCARQRQWYSLWGRQSRWWCTVGHDGGGKWFYDLGGSHWRFGFVVWVVRTVPSRDSAGNLGTPWEYVEAG